MLEEMARKMAAIQIEILAIQLYESDCRNCHKNGPSWENAATADIEHYRKKAQRFYNAI